MKSAIQIYSATDFQLQLSTAIPLSSHRMIGKRKTRAKQTWWLATLLLVAFMWAAECGNNESGNAAPENRVIAAIRIVDQYGREAPSGRRYVGSEIFDVTVGPLENEFSFVPDTVNISVGDTVRCTWRAIFTVSPVAMARPAPPMGNFVRLIT